MVLLMTWLLVPVWSMISIASFSSSSSSLLSSSPSSPSLSLPRISFLEMSSFEGASYKTKTLTPTGNQGTNNKEVMISVSCNLEE